MRHCWRVDAVIRVVVPVQLVDMCQLDLAGNWTTSEPEHSSAVLSKEAKVLGKNTRKTCSVECLMLAW